MDNINCNSKLEMIDIYFSSFSFEQKKKIGESNLITEFHVDYAQNKDDISQIRVQISTVLRDDEGCFHLDLQTVGLFRLEKGELDDATVKTILTKNTVSIMFPFIRSQIALLTAQPGLNSVLLQPIDVNTLVDKILE